MAFETQGGFTKGITGMHKSLEIRLFNKAYNARVFKHVLCHQAGWLVCLS